MYSFKVATVTSSRKTRIPPSPRRKSVHASLLIIFFLSHLIDKKNFPIAASMLPSWLYSLVIIWLCPVSALLYLYPGLLEENLHQSEFTPHHEYQIFFQPNLSTARHTTRDGPDNPVFFISGIRLDIGEFTTERVYYAPLIPNLSTRDGNPAPLHAVSGQKLYPVSSCSVFGLFVLMFG